MVKVGLRKPSLKKSISARTKGRATRMIKRAVIPGYGKKGMGWAHPKRKLYNALYQRTTVDTRKILADAIKSPNNKGKVSATNSKFRNSRSQTTSVNQQNNKLVNFLKTTKGLNCVKAVREITGWSIWLSILFQEPFILTFIFLVIWISLQILTSRRSWEG